MKRKGLVITGIVLGGLVLTLILFWLAAPLWARLGLEPFCIQGSWPDLKIVTCPQETAVLPSVIVQPLPTPGEDGPIPVIVDDDGSPDGMLALLYFLRNPLFDVRAITISCGEAHPDIFVPHVQRLLAGLGRTDIPVGVGRSTPLAGNNAFPEPWRQASDDFWDIAYPQAPVSLQSVPAAELIVKTLENSAQPVMIFVGGNHTNIAEALRKHPGITEHIRKVHIMGGSVYAPGNIASDWPEIDNEVAEWNIWVDPVAAKEVFGSGIPLHITPLDATNQVVWTQSDALAWAASGTPEGALAGNILQWMLDSWSAEGVFIWDLVAAVSASDPTSCPETLLALDILVSPGPEQGRTVISDGAPDVSLCLTPVPERITALVEAFFGK